MILFYIYVATLIVGGILLLASIVLGGGSAGDVHAAADAHLDADASADVDAPAGLEATVDADAQVDADTHGDLEIGAPGTAGVAFSDFWLPFLSLRFWVFFATFFGLTGTALSLTQLAGPALTFLSASALGGVSGFAAAFIVRRLREGETGTVPTPDSYRGKEALVLLPVGPTERGKVRLSVDGSDIDLLARTEDEQELPAGTRVLVIDIHGNEVVVVRSPTETQTAS